MINKIKNLILPFLFVGILPLQAQQTKVSNYTNNRYPLLQKPFVELPIGAKRLARRTNEPYGYRYDRSHG